MNHIFIDELIQNCLTMLKQLDFKESVIKRHQRRLFNLKDYMKLEGQNSYDESVGEKYLLDMLQKGNTRECRLKETKHSINLINDILNHVPLRKKRIHAKTYPYPGEYDKLIQSFLEQLKIECRPARHTLYMYMTALSHFAVRMHQDNISPDSLDNIAINRFVSSLQNTQLRVCRPVRRFLYYLYQRNVSKTDLSIPLLNIKSHRAEKLPSLYNTEEIRKMDASIEKTSKMGKRNYAIFMLASRLGLRASQKCITSPKGAEHRNIFCFFVTVRCTFNQNS